MHRCQSPFCALEMLQQIALGERTAALATQAAGAMPLLVVLIGGPQSDLGVDRGRSADAVTPEDDQRWLVRARRVGERGRIPQGVVGVRLPAHVIGSGAVRPGL